MSYIKSKNIWKAINVAIDSNEFDDKTIDMLINLQVLNEYLERQT